MIPVCRYKKKIYDLVKEHVESADDVAEVSSSKQNNDNIVIILFRRTYLSNIICTLNMLLHKIINLLFVSTHRNHQISRLLADAHSKIYVHASYK